MKLIALVLSLATFVAAQEEKEYYVVLRSNTPPARNLYAGYLRLTQYGSIYPVEIHAKIGWLPSGWYKFVVHEVNENTSNCDSLGPVVDLGFGTAFDLAYEYIDRSGFKNFTKFSWSPTLEPNKPTSLIGRAIAVVQEPIYDVLRGRRYFHRVCGAVLTKEAIERKNEYYKAWIAGDPKFDAATVWF